MSGFGHLAGMVKVSEIVDRDSLEAWLLDQPEDETKGFAIAIAHRATMRVLPVYWLWAVQNPHLFASPNFALPELRCAIIASVAQKSPTYELKKAAVSAVRLLEQNAADAVGIITIEDISRCLARAAYVVNDDSAFSTIAAKAVELTSFADHKWKHIKNDCAALEGGNSLRNTPLFREKMNPFQEDWDAVRTSLSPDWSFWINWYQDALDGRAPDWDMLYEIALIPDEDWKKGPARVNFLIGEIQAKYLSAFTPLAERIEFDPPVAKFHAIPQEPTKPDLLAATLSQVEDAMEDALADTGNGLREDSREVRVLNRTILRHSNDPQRIEMDFTSVAIGLRRQIEETQELPNSEGNLALLEAVEEGARAIRATHPDVAENRMILAGQVLRELPNEDIAVLDEAKDVLVVISEGVMAEDFAEDIPQLINDALLPLPNGAPPLPAMDPAVRVFGRVSRMAMMMQKSGEIVETIHNSKGYKALGIVARGVKITAYLYFLVSIGLRLFGIL